MNSLLSILLHLLFWQRLLRYLMMIGGAFALLGLILCWFNPGSKGAIATLVGGTGFALLFSVMTAPVGLRQLLGNRQLALVPNLRWQAGLALFLLAVLVSLIYAGIASLVSETPVLTPSMLMFCALSGYFLLAQWALSYKWGAIAFWLLPAVLLQLPRNNPLLQWLQTPAVSLTVLMLSLLAWLVFAQWLRRLRTTAAPRFVMDQWNNPELQHQQHQGWLTNRVNFRGIRSASGSLLRGAYDNWRNRLLMQVVLFFLFPIVLNLFFAVLELAKGRDYLERILSSHNWLMMGLFGSLMISFYTREWLPRARLLWLRSGGSRAELWQLIQTMTRQEVLLSALVSGLYAFLLWQFTGLSAAFSLAFVLICTTVPWLTINVTHWSRLRDWGWMGSIVLMLALMAAMAVVLVLGFKRDSIVLPLLFAALCAGLGYLVERRTQQRFLRIDWCQLRPISLRSARTGC